MDLGRSERVYLEWLGENEPEYLRYLLQTHQSRCSGNQFIGKECTGRIL